MKCVDQFVSQAAGICNVLGDEQSRSGVIDLVEEIHPTISPIKMWSISPLTAGASSQSGFRAIRVRIAASSAAAVTNLKTLTRGYWRISGQVTYSSAVLEDADEFIRISDDRLLTFENVINLMRVDVTQGLQMVPFAFDIHSRNNFTFQFDQVATGVGQILRLYFSLHYQKLLGE